MSEKQVVLLTGAAGGLGSALANALAPRALAGSLELVLLDNNETGLDQLADRMQSARGYEPLIYPLDLETATADQFSQLADSVATRLGRLDLLFHCAARFTALAPMAHADPVEWLRILQTNLNGPWLLTRSCLPLLQKGTDSRIVFVLEDLVTMREANWGAYGVSKLALDGLVAQLSAELDHQGIRVDGINPGPMRTALRAKAWMPSPEDPARPVDEVAERIARWLDSGEPWVEFNGTGG